MQIVLTSTNPLELCINGMSFSRRSSRWANAALVVTVSAKDFDTLDLRGPLAGVKFQVSFLFLAFGFYFHISYKKSLMENCHNIASRDDTLFKIRANFDLCSFIVQREFEQRAAIMGGGNFVVPAQKVTDFLENKLSGRKFLISILLCFTKSSTFLTLPLFYQPHPCPHLVID